jgi:hypothetical protein
MEHTNYISKFVANIISMTLLCYTNEIFCQYEIEKMFKYCNN